MGKFILFLTIVSSSLCSAQSQLISGMIVDERGNPVSDVKVYQIGAYRMIHSDFYGAFHTVVDTLYSDSIVFSGFGFLSQIIGNIDTISSPLSVVLLDDHDNELYMPAAYEPPRNTEPRKFDVLLSFMGDFNRYDFGEFEPFIGSYNLEHIKNSGGFLGADLALTWRSFSWAVSYGLMQNSIEDDDSLNIRINNSQYATHFGFDLLDSRRFRITPRIGIKWTRFRLINNAVMHQIPIEQYVQDRDLDMRFNQLSSFVGLRLALKVGSDGFIGSDYIEFGAYFGYHFGLNEVPWVYSSRNRLRTENTLELANISGGVHVTFVYSGN